MPEDLEPAPEGFDQEPDSLEGRIDRLLDEQLRRKTEAIAQELSDQLKSTYAAAVSTASAEAASSVRAEFAQSLADSARRIRAEDSVTGIATALVDGASQYCGRSLLFIHRGDQLLGFRVAGRVGAQDQEGFQKLSVPVKRAAGVSRVIETLQATAVAGGEDELSSDVTQLLGLTGEDRVHLFPVALRDKVLAVLACDAGPAADDADSTSVIAPAIETLVALAEAWIEAVGTRRKQSSAA